MLVGLFEFFGGLLEFVDFEFVLEFLAFEFEELVLF